MAGLGELDGVLLVSRSRISPIRMTSGAWRKVFLSAVCHESVSTPTFAVGNHTPFVLMHVPRWIFDGDDVAAGLLVAIAHHRRERGRLAGAGATHENHEAALGQHDFLENGRQVELFETGDLGVDQGGSRSRRPPAERTR